MLTDSSFSPVCFHDLSIEDLVMRAAWPAAVQGPDSALGTLRMVSAEFGRDRRLSGLIVGEPVSVGKPLRQARA